MEVSHCKLEIYIPASHFRLLQQALQEAGAGHLGNYDSCLAYSPVTGTWRTLAGAQPYHGREGEVSEAPELKVEVVVEMDNLDRTMVAIHDVHPYEQPLINVIPLWGIGSRK